ncbi:hypothetical protein CC80DRAFT_552877 [Byssothecium circinans]|uniref:Uncharacterized protein n=1 Tax=Byssothecium circinans TaxID=147558 RepID=A0A6A5TJH0_9PLEO|nr:hypothetical protein CC80DRAFT_552877 [Byssothecium circinans]
MSKHQRLAALEAHIQENQRKIEQLTAENMELLTRNNDQERELYTLASALPLQEDYAINSPLTRSPVDLDTFSDVKFRSPTPAPSSSRIIHNQGGPSPLAGWDANARDAVHGLRFAIGIRGEHGELLEFMLDLGDFGSVVVATLRRRGWSDRHIQAAVIGFHQWPLIRVMQFET